jgi:hypothetical protein
MTLGANIAVAKLAIMVSRKARTASAGGKGVLHELGHKEKERHCRSDKQYARQIGFAARRC